MPISGWHAARIKSPDDFKDGSLITLKIGGNKTGILLISGKLKNGGKKLVEQSYRFSMDKFTADQAKAWLKDHKKKFILFEEGKKPEKSMNYDDIECGGEIDVKNLVDYEDITEEKSNEVEYKIFNLEVTEVKILNVGDDEKGVFVGAMASQAKDLGDDVIDSGAFDETIADYKKKKQNIQLYYNHNTMGLPIGIISFKNIEQDGKNWLVKGELNLDTQTGSEVYALMKQGALTDLSIGYIVTDAEFKGSTRIIKNLMLQEVSVVGKGMNPKAKINAVKSIEQDNNNELENVNKFDINYVKNISTKAEFNETLRKSGVFSNGACEFLASCFMPKQSKSVTDKNGNDAELLVLLEIKNILKNL